MNRLKFYMADLVYWLCICKIKKSKFPQNILYVCANDVIKKNAATLLQVTASLKLYLFAFQQYRQLFGKVGQDNFCTCAFDTQN